VNTYLVGGAVRDRLLDIPCQERDWVVVGATVQDMLDAGFKPADPDADFPVFLHPDSGEEYALARRETKTGAGYRGFAVEAGSDVTLEQDLARRDLTINAMAEAADGSLIDPYHGRDDLAAGLLRHVTDAFVEDPVRLLRIARFAAKLGEHGFRVAHPTHKLMKQMAADADLKALRPERVWLEMKRALAEAQPWRFFEVLQRCGVLAVLIPELDAVLADGAGHGERAEAPPISALKRACAVELGPPWRLAVLLVAIPADIEPLLTRLRAEKLHAQAARLLRALAPTYPTLPTGSAADWLAFFEQGRALRQPEAFEQALLACAALYPEVDADLPQRLLTARQAAAEVDARQLQAEGLQGAALGEALRSRRLAALADLRGLHR
jgi:tRNA nucleotidyltransferase (CCA-adding enzyme)